MNQLIEDIRTNLGKLEEEISEADRASFSHIIRSYEEKIIVTTSARLKCYRISTEGKIFNLEKTLEIKRHQLRGYRYTIAFLIAINFGLLILEYIQ